MQPDVADDAQIGALTAFKLGAFDFRLAHHAAARQQFEQCQTLMAQLPDDAPDKRWLNAYLSEFMARIEMEQDAEAAYAWLEEGVASLDPFDTVDAHYYQGFLHVVASEILGRILGRLGPARQALERGLQQLPAEPTPARLTALINLGTVHGFAGDNEVARAYFEQGVAVAEQLGDRRRLGVLSMNLGIQSQRKGDLASAAHSYDKALAHFRQIGDTSQEGTAQVNVAMVHIIWGDDELAIDQCQRAVTMAEQWQLSKLHAVATATMLRPLWRLERIAALRQQLSTCQTLCRTLRNGQLLTHTMLWQSRLQALDGDHVQAIATLEQAIQQAQAERYLLEEGIAWSFLGQLHDQTDQPQRAQPAHQQAITILQEQDLYELALAEWHYATHLHQQGATDAAIEQATASRARLQQLAAKSDLQQVDAFLSSFS